MTSKPLAFATRTLSGPLAGIRLAASLSVTRVRVPKVPGPPAGGPPAGGFFAAGFGGEYGAVNQAGVVIGTPERSRNEELARS